jgi:hypothetical protein
MWEENHAECDEEPQKWKDQLGNKRGFTADVADFADMDLRRNRNGMA